jgi:hypothetical protein
MATHNFCLRFTTVANQKKYPLGSTAPSRRSDVQRTHLLPVVAERERGVHLAD